jgi:hypothetical protein
MLDHMIPYLAALGAIWLRRSLAAPAGDDLKASKVAEYMLIQLRRISSTAIHSAL